LDNAKPLAHDGRVPISDHRQERIMTDNNAATVSRLSDRRPPRAASLTSGYHVAFTLGAGLLIVAIALAAVLLRPDARAEAGGHEASGDTGSRPEPDCLPQAA
jgi:hypothetical protein